LLLRKQDKSGRSKSLPFSYVPARNAPIRSSNEISRSRSPIQGDGDEESHRMSASLVGLKISVRLRRLRSTSPPPPAGQWSGSERVKRAYVPRRRTSFLPIQPLTALHRTPTRRRRPTPPDRVPFARGHVARWLAARVSQPGPQRPLDGDGRRIGDHLANWPGGSCRASSIAYESGVTYRRRGVEQCGRRVVGADPTAHSPRGRGPRRDRRLRSSAVGSKYL